MVLLKTYRQRNEVLERFKEYGLDETGIYAARLGMEGEIVTDDLEQVAKMPEEYLSMLVCRGLRAIRPRRESQAR